MGLFDFWLKKGNSGNRKPIPTNKPEGFYIVRNDFGEVQADTLFQKAKAGDISAQMTIAKCFMDAGKRLYALPWYEKAADKGNSQALHELTYFYEGHYVGVDADPVKAEIVRKKALEANNPKAFLKMASQYYTGSGVEKDRIKAFQYYMKAAELGDDEGMAEVGVCYLNGDGVIKNDEQAFRWLSRSKDSYYGYYNLAQCYLHGKGTKVDREKAVIYLEKAIRGKCLDLDDARRQLVELYKQGYGGTEASAKRKRIEEDIARSDKLIRDLADLNL